MPISKRVFLGIMISQELKNQIKSFYQKYQNLPVNWVDSNNLHITLVPPFCTIEMDKLIKVLNNYNFSKPFDIEAKSINFGPEISNPRLIWLKIKASEKLYNLKKDIYKSLNLKLSDNNFLPHITLAKFKYLDKKHLDTKFNDFNFNEKVESFDLIQLIDVVGGSKYISKHKFKL